MIGYATSHERYAQRRRAMAQLNAALIARAQKQREKLLRLMAYLKQRVRIEERLDVRELLEGILRQATEDLADFDGALADMQARVSLDAAQERDGVCLILLPKNRDPRRAERLARSPKS